MNNSRVLVTGATSGIGEATARRFAQLGAEVVVSGRDRERGDNVVASIEAKGGRARFVQADLGDTGDVLRLAEQAGEIDVLVNNAGGSPFAGTADLPADLLHSVFDLNVIAPFLLVGRLAPRMAERGAGAIVNVSSFAGGHGIPPLGAYGAAKAGIDLLTKAWAVEFGASGVRVNAVSPGSIRTPAAATAGEMFDRTADATPLGRAGTAEEIAAAITFLVSDDAAYITGAVLPVDAGMSAG